MATPRVVAVLVLDPVRSAVEGARERAADLLEETLDSLAAQSRPPDALLVLARHSTYVQDAAETATLLEVVRTHPRLVEAVPSVDILEPTTDSAAAQGAGRNGAPRRSAGQESQVAAWNRALEHLAGPQASPSEQGPGAGGSDPDAIGAIGAIGATPATVRAEAADWLWLLRHDTAPLTTALAALLTTSRQSGAVGIVGPKLVQWRDPRRLVEMGWQVTRAGRRIDAPTWGEPDQGQYDDRSDVIAVAAGGMLVREDVLRGLGGFDTAFGDVAADLDLGWRAQLLGHRVVVSPAARVRDGALSSPSGTDPTYYVLGMDGPETVTDVDGEPPLPPTATLNAAEQPVQPRGLLARRASERRAARRVALTRCAVWTVPFLALWVTITSIAGAALLLLLKRPAHAWVALGDVTALVHPWSGTRSRWRFWRRTRRTSVRRSHLAPVFVGAGAAASLTWDRVQEAVTLERDRRRATSPTPSEATETGPVAEEAEDLTVLPASLPQRILTHPGSIAVLLSIALAAAFYRSSLGAGVLDPHGAGLVGGELQPLTTDASGLWHLYRDAWHGAGMGGTSVVGPGVALLAGLTWLLELVPGVAGGRSPAAVTVTWLLLAAMPLSTFTAYVAGRVATRARWPRALVALAWGSSAVITTALAQGRASVVVAHVMLPLVMAGFAASCCRRTTWTSTFATALATAVLAAFVPVLGAVAAVVGVGIVLFGPRLGAQVRGLVLTVVPVALLGPWVLEAVHHPLLLLTGEGTIDVSSVGVAPWQTALGLSAPAGAHRALLFVPLLLAALLGLSRRGRGDGRSAALTSLAVLALVGLGGAFLAGRLVVGSAPDASGVPVPASPWAGVELELYVAATLAVVLVAWRGAAAATAESRWGATRFVLGAAVVVIALAVVGTAALAGRDGLGSQLTMDTVVLPAVAADQANGPDATRLLVIEPDGGSDGVVGYRLVGAEPGAVMRDVETVGSPDPLVTEVVGSIASTPVADVTGPGLGSRLADLGIGFVALRADATSGLARTLDAASGLTRLGTTDDQTLWRVLPRASVDPSQTAGVPASRVRLVSTAGGTTGLLAALPVSGPHAGVDTTLPAGRGRVLVVAESPAWADAARVTYDGRVLAETDRSGQPSYVVPDAAGRLVVDVPPTHQQWFLGQLGLALVVLFLAVPFGTRRSRRVS